MKKIEFIEYQSKDNQKWDEIVKLSNSYSFLHERNYMEYHKDRFQDLSFFVKIQNELVGVIPGTILNNNYSSHSGLTFGGLIVKPNKSSQNYEIMENFIKHLNNSGVKNIRISRMPDMYKDSIDDGDMYALIKNGFRISRFSLSQVINLKNGYKFPSNKQRGANKAKRDGIRISTCDDSRQVLALAAFNTKQKYGVQITHSYLEMNSLISKFPENIKCFEVHESSEMVCGAILYKSKNVNHLQYLASSERGRKLRGQDYLMEFLLELTLKEEKYFSFGSSTESNGMKLNENLMKAKEEYGAYSVVTLEFEKNSK